MRGVGSRSTAGSVHKPDLMANNGYVSQDARPVHHAPHAEEVVGEMNFFHGGLSESIEEIDHVSLCCLSEDDLFGRLILRVFYSQILLTLPCPCGRVPR